jgi:tRNA(fMet)-specific endonuclease VapC
MTIADTDVLIDYLANKGEAEVVERLLRRGLLRTTVISRFELLSGAKDQKQLARLLQFLEAVPSLALDEEAADVASDIRRVLDRSGKSIGMADSLIAGIVVRNGGVLLTRNYRHFERVPGLRLARSHENT